MAYTRNPTSVKAGTALRQTPTSNSLAPPGAVSVELHANIASVSQLGVVQIGKNILVSPEGIISVDLPASNYLCNTVLISNNYIGSINDCYIGVNSSVPVKVTLPVPIVNGKQIIVKAEMGAPMGTRKITIVTSDSSLIDGSPSYTINTPYSSASFISRANTWHKV